MPPKKHHHYPWLKKLQDEVLNSLLKWFNCLRRTFTKLCPNQRPSFQRHSPFSEFSYNPEYICAEVPLCFLLWLGMFWYYGQYLCSPSGPTCGSLCSLHCVVSEKKDIHFVMQYCGFILPFCVCLFICIPSPTVCQCPPHYIFSPLLLKMKITASTNNDLHTNSALRDFFLLPSSASTSSSTEV